MVPYSQINFILYQDESIVPFCCEGDHKSQLYCADMLLNRIFCSYGNHVSPLPNKPAFTLPILSPSHPNTALGANMASRYSPYTTHHYSVFSLLSMPWPGLLSIRYCWFVLPLIHKKLGGMILLSDHWKSLCCVWAGSQISFQTGETLILMHSWASHPLQVSIFLHASTANETKGCDRAQSRELRK